MSARRAGRLGVAKIAATIAYIFAGRSTRSFSAADQL
jgi:hypothetical protein